MVLLAFYYVIGNTKFTLHCGFNMAKVHATFQDCDQLFFTLSPMYMGSSDLIMDCLSLSSLQAT